MFILFPCANSCALAAPSKQVLGHTCPAHAADYKEHYRQLIAQVNLILVKCHGNKF